MNGVDNQDDLKVLGLDFSDLYQHQHIQFALADLISQDIKDKPIIAAHPYGCNNISALSEKLISQKDKETINKELKEKEKEANQETRRKLEKLSKDAIAEEFDAMFALLKANKRPVLYNRWMPKDDELLMASRPNHKGHYVCLYFFYDHNNEKSILIANPNGHEITDEHEAAVISSYLENNKSVKIYQSKDYLQFDNATCGPGALMLLRMIHNMSKQDFLDVLENGKQNASGTTNKFDFTSIELGHDALQKEIGKVPKGEKENKDMDQKMRLADYNTAKIYEENHTDLTEDMIAITLGEISFNQELIKGDLTEDQVELLNKSLLSGKQMLTSEQTQQAQKEREEIFGAKDKKAVKIQLDDECIKDPKTTLSNEGAKHTRDNVRRKLSSDTQHTEKSEPVKISLTAIAFVAAVIFFISILADVKKEFKIAGIVISSIMLISVVTCLCLPKKPKSMIINSGVTLETTPFFQQPHTK